nr:hypothetical protein [Tanacetum cinerariifolium]
QNGEALRKCILSGYCKPTTVLVQAVDAPDDSLAIPEHTTVETPMNMSPENKAHFEAEKEAIHLILTRIGDEIYSTVDACQTAQEIWEAIERLQQARMVKKNLALIVKYFKKIYKPTNNYLRTSSNSRNKNVDTTPQYKKDSQSRQFGNQRTVNVSGAREKLGTDSEPVEQVQNNAEYNVFVNDLQHSEKYEYVSNTCLVETDDSNVIPDSPDMCEDDIQNEQNDVESDDERVALANLIANLKLDVDESKKIQKQLKKAKTTLAQELKECKTILVKTSKSLGESISVRDSCLVALQTKQTLFEKYKVFNDRTIDYDKLEHKLNEALGKLAQKETVIREGLKTKAYEISLVKQKHDELMKQSLLIKSHYEGLVKQKMKTCLMPLAIKTQYDSFKFVHELKQEMHANLKYIESLEKEIDKLESDKVKECDSLAQKISKQTESVNKKAHTELLQRFAKVEKHSISLEIALQKCKEQNIAISELKKPIEKGKGKYVDTKFDRPSVVRQPNAQRILKPSVLGKPAPFSNSLDRIYFPKTKSVPKTNVSEGLSKPVAAHTLPQTAKKAVSNTNVLKPGMYKIDNRTTYTRAP